MEKNIPLGKNIQCAQNLKSRVAKSNLSSLRNKLHLFRYPVGTKVLNREASAVENSLEGTWRPFSRPTGATSPSPLPEGAQFMGDKEEGEKKDPGVTASCTEAGHIPAVAGRARCCWNVLVNNCGKITTIN